MTDAISDSEDNSSISSSSKLSSLTSSFSNISVCDEIGQLIENCEHLHHHIHNSFQTLHSIRSLIDAHTNINIVHEGKTEDFDEYLEKLHTEALENILTDCHNNFGERLLHILSKCEFN
jgi:hypothetical protein